MSKYIKALILFLAGIVLVACCVFLFTLLDDYTGQAAQEAFVIMGMIITGTLSLPCFGVGLAFLIGASYDW